MKNYLPIIIPAAALAAALGAGAWPTVRETLFPADPEAAFITACEAELKDRLAAPSTYRRREQPFIMTDPADPADIVGRIPANASAGDRDNLLELRKLWEEVGGYRHRALIRYEAANAYGTPIAGDSLCDYYSFSEKIRPDERFTTVRIDGRTNLQRLEDMVRGAGR